MTHICTFIPNIIWPFLAQHVLCYFLMFHPACYLEWVYRLFFVSFPFLNCMALHKPGMVDVMLAVVVSIVDLK